MCMISSKSYSVIPPYHYERVEIKTAVSAVNYQSYQGVDLGYILFPLE